MQSLIYAGLRNGERDQKIHDALTYKRVIEVAIEFQLHPNTIRKASKRIESLKTFDLQLLGGVARFRSERWRLTRFGKPPLAPTGTTTAPFETLTFPAGLSPTALKAWK